MSDPVMQNMSPLNPVDATAMMSSGKFDPNMSIKDAFAQVGIDVNGPVSQLTDYGQKMKMNANPINKMRNMAAGASLKPGGQPPTMPGAKPMVQPPAKPAPAGLEGLMSKIGR